MSFKKKILLVADVRGWAYDDASQNWKALLSKEYDIDIIYLSDYKTLKMTHGIVRFFRQMQTSAFNGESIDPKDFLNYYKLFTNEKGQATPPIFNHNDYDGILFFYHRAVCDYRLLNTPFPLDKVAISINNEKWVGEENLVFEHYFKGSRVLTGCNQFVIDKFKNIHPNVMRVSQSINQKVFNVRRKAITSDRKGAEFIVGWSGNFSNTIKNYSLVKAACKTAKVKLLTAKKLDRAALNVWYNKVDAVICASDSEGGPLMLLEAGACAVPVITVPVGLSREIIKNGQNGLIVDRTPRSISKAINRLQANKQERLSFAVKLNKEILDNWTYESRVDEVRAVFKEICKS